MMMNPFDTGEIEDVVHARGRLNILAYLSTMDHADFMQIVEAVNLAKGSVAQHLKKLEDAGYVTTRRVLMLNKTKTTCALTSEGRKAFDDYFTKIHGIFEAVKASNAQKSNHRKVG